jgi:hypothetical protein
VTQLGTRAWPKILRWIIAISLCCAGGFFVLFTTWAPYDDEGYILWTLIHQSQSHILYDEIFTQYGPAFYWLDSTLRSIIPLPRTTDGQRWQTLFFWLTITAIATATLRNFVVNRFENQSLQSTLFFLSSFGLLFWHLDRLAMEPGHPQNWCTLLTVVLLWLLSFRTKIFSTPFSLPQCILLGAICGILTMIKPNVGILALAGLPASLFWNSSNRSSRILTYTEIAYTIILSLLPWLIMHRQIGNVSNWLHPLLVTTSLLLVRREYLLLEAHNKVELSDLADNCYRFSRIFQRCLAIGLGASLPIFAFTLWTLEQGSHLAQFHHALFGQHQTLMTLYYYPSFQSSIPWFSVIGALVVLITLYFRVSVSLHRSVLPQHLQRYWYPPALYLNKFLAITINRLGSTRNHRMVLVVICLGSTLCLFWTIMDCATPLLHGLKPRGTSGFLLAAMPWIAWLWIRNRRQETTLGSLEQRESKIRPTSCVRNSPASESPDTNLSLLAIAILQTMIAFPVPGTQLALGTLGLLILGLDVTRIAVRDLVDHSLTLTVHPRTLSLSTCWTVGIIILLFLPISFAASRYYSREPLNLAGARFLRLSDENTRTTRELVNTLQELEVDTVVFQWHNRSSWLLWADQNPLCYALPPSWPYLLNAQQQQRSFETLRNATQIAVIDEDYGPQVEPAFSILQDTWQKESQCVRRIGEFEVKLWRPQNSLHNAAQPATPSQKSDRG